MKKFLSIFLLVFSFGLISQTTIAHAQTPNQQIDQAPVAPDGSWVIDPEVTFIGKNAARSGYLLNYTLKNYNWVCVTPQANGPCDNSNNPLTNVWLTTVTYIVVPLLFIVILVTAIVIVVTRGKSLTMMRFLPRFVAVILLIFFSFAIIQFFYQFTDVIQGFFLRPPGSNESCPPTCISNVNLLYVQWDYTKFEGLRKVGNVNSESAFITLLLTKLTALTYFVMVGLLFLRRIILWLFIIVSPIFPILLLFYPVRNTGKIWIGEFFRWLLYAPLFAIFLRGLVFLWQPGAGGRPNNIPLNFLNPAIHQESQIIYPTAVNILLGGPGQFVDLTNSVNVTETFALYVVSLLMLWGVIILPWILLQIFLDYAQNVGVGDSAVMKNMMGIINRQGGPPGTPHGPAPSGTSISLPFAKKFSMPPPPTTPAGIAMEIPVSNQSKYSTAYMPSAQVKAQVLSLSNVTLPSMRDIAKFDTSLISRDTSRQKEAITIRDNLVKIGNPASSSSSSDKERYTEIREKLIKESNNGNTLATSILTAANTASKRSSTATTSQIKSMLTQIANPQAASAAGATSVINREKLSKMNESLVKAKKEGNTLASAILSVTDKTPTVEIEKLQEKIRDAKEKGEPVATQIAAAMEKKDILPVANRVQTVSKEDYQAVKDMWKENYQNLEVPEGMAGTRTEWVKDDIAKIDNIIALLDSKDEEKISQGMEEVSGILPFLLVGGFSQAEIVAYLKAKQEAAKEVVESLNQEEEDKVSVSVKKKATESTQMAASISDDSKGVETSDDESSLSNLSSASTNIGTKQVSDEILSLVDIKLPSIRDIARYEALSISKDKLKTTEVEKANEILKNIANPESITDTTERQRYKKIKEKLLSESSKGNIIATAILSASNGTNTSSIPTVQTSTKDVLSQIANPSLVVKEADKKRFTSLHDELAKASKEGSPLATSLLTVKDNVTKEELENLTAQLNEERRKGNMLASSVLSNITGSVSLPSTNRIQNVSQEDYKTVKDMWKENYRGLEVPKELATTRTEWIKQDIEKIGKVVNMLSSTDQAQISQGMEEVSGILPFLLVGGFSQAEIVAYLKAKQEAAKEVVVSLDQEEEDKVSVSVKKKATESTQMAASTSENSVENNSSISNINTQTKNINSPQSVVEPLNNAANEILKLTNLELPKLTDIVKYEVRSLTKDKTESERIEKMHSVLEKIGSPTSITTAEERKKYEILREKLEQESINGNTAASTILSAVSQLNKTASDIEVTVEELKNMLVKIANPQNVEQVDDRDYYTRLHEFLLKEKQEHNSVIAQKVLSINETTDTNEIQTVSKELMTVQQDGNPALSQIRSAVKDFVKVKQLRGLIQSVTSTTSQETNQTYSKIKESLALESSKGNPLATSIMSVKEGSSESEVQKVRQIVMESSQKGDPTAKEILSFVSQQQKAIPGSLLKVDMPAEEFRTTFAQIANPSIVPSIEDRSTYTKLHDYVEKESKENNNQLAQKILTISEASNISDVEQIKDQLVIVKPGAKPALPELTIALDDISQLNQFKRVVNQIISSKAPISQASSEKVAKLRESLTQAKKKGDSLADSLLSVNNKTSDSALIQLHKKLVDADKKGDPTAKEILSQVSESNALSNVNRLREVTPEEYQEAKELWEKAYKQYLVPPGFTEDIKGRSEWISSDISDIEQTLGFLESSDAEKREEGIKKVSGILPFLLLGGFSYDEMNSYLKTKLDAAKLALTEIQQEEDNKILVDVHNPSISENTISAAVPEYSAEDSSVGTVPVAKKNIVIPQEANEILSLANLSLPTIQDIARYESTSLFKDKSTNSDIEKMREALEKITNPTVIPVSSEREKYQKLQEKLKLESEKENPLAASVLTAATLISQNNINTPTTNQLKNAFIQIINPDSADSSQDRKRLEELRNMLSKDAHDNNNKLAAQILSVNEKTTGAEIEKIREQLRSGQKQASSLASSVIWSINKSVWGSLATEQVKGVLLKVAKPDLITNPEQKIQFSKVHDALQAERDTSELAKSILEVGETTPNLEINRITDELKETSANPVMADVNNLIYKNQSMTQLRNILKQVANPASVLNTSEHGEFTKINNSLKKSSSEGNEMAKAILAVNSDTPDIEIEKLQQQIEQGKNRKEPIANEISMLVNRPIAVSLPAVNRIQAVSKDDYAAVKNTWIESYKSLEVPASIGLNRYDWIKADLSKIDNVISDLSSNDQEQISQGMNGVSDILPFLLIGGFSQTEIIEYLKSKKEAGEETLAYLSKEEDTELPITKGGKVNTKEASEEIPDEEKK